MLHVTLTGLLLSIALSAALVPSLGAEGASTASAVTEFVLAGAYWSRWAETSPISTLASGLLRVAVAAALARLRAAATISSFFLWAISSAAYLAVLLLLRAFPPELLHVLRPRAAPATS